MTDDKDSKIVPPEPPVDMASLTAPTEDLSKLFHLLPLPVFQSNPSEDTEEKEQ